MTTSTIESVAELMHRAVQLQASCLCVYKRADKVPVWLEGERILEKQCLRCEAIAAYAALQHG